MINLYVCSEYRIPVYLVGTTGLSKTSMTKAFSLNNKKRICNIIFI